MKPYAVDVLVVKEACATRYAVVVVESESLICPVGSVQFPAV
jgi:hypothetical protein